MTPRNIFGYGTYMIGDEGFRNVEEDGRCIGFQLQMRLANYRGYILSQIEEIKISVDDESIPRKDIRVCLGGKTYTLDQMENVVDDRWELLQTATVTCLKAGGLAPGAHSITAEEHIRASYIPMIAASQLTKTLTLEHDPTKAPPSRRS